jgi:hypothetical protein
MTKLSAFTEKEVRWDYYPMFLKLMEKGCEIEAFMFILSTWNFACFRYVMREFDLDAFTDTVKKLNRHFEEIQHEEFKTMDIGRYSNVIKHIFKTFADIKGIESTGAPKLMHLKLPNVFVMWDRYIRKAYGYNKGDAEDYVAFLTDMQNRFADNKIDSSRTLAKIIDEHNYKKFTMPELNKARAKRKKS